MIFGSATQPSTTSAAAKQQSITATDSWRNRLSNGLSKTRRALTASIGDLFSQPQIDDDLFETLEATLLAADCGVTATQYLLNQLKEQLKGKKPATSQQLHTALKDLFVQLLLPLEQPLDVTTQSPFIIMLAGVNGAGKTTTIGKLAARFRHEGHSVLLAAGDTFRAAASEQLVTLGQRNNVTVVTQENSDAAAVIFDAINAAHARKINVVLADTAGRLPTQSHLMAEIAKVRRVINKADAQGPHEVLLVLDASTGQNALAQVQAFDKAIHVNGLVVTKLDGTARGGILAAIAHQCPKPVRYIGVGEAMDDLQVFRASEFADALFGTSTS